jgi:glycosyltransferase involved in cell wall biosynthesis
MKIFYIYTALTTKGGADRVVIEKANWFARQGHDVAVVTDSQMGRIPPFQLFYKVRLIDLSIDFGKEYGHSFIVRSFIYFKLMRVYRKMLKDLLMEERPDIVVTTLGRDIDFLTKIRDGSIKVGEAHTTKMNIRNFHLLESRNFFLKILTKYFRWSMDCQINKLNALVVLTEQQINDWPSSVPKYAIPNALPFYPESISTCENKRAIIVGRYTEAKGYDYMIEAWRIVHQKHPDWTIHTYAMGEEEERVRAKIQSYGLQDTIIMNPPTDDIMSEYLNSSICVVSSVFEGFSMVLIEAMACGLPCVSFDCPYGPRNIINDGEDGYLVEYLNTEALADSICKLIEDKELRNEMGRKGRTNVLRFSREKVMQQWVTLFDSLLKGKEA